MRQIWLIVCAMTGLLAAAPAATAATRTVCASGCGYTNLQAAIDAAQPGDTILLRAGATFVGHYILRKKSGTADIVIRSDAPDSDLPGPGVRLVPSWRPGGNTSLSKLPHLVGRGGAYRTTPIFKTENGAHNYRLKFLDIDGRAQQGWETLVAIGNNTTQTSASLAPYNIVFDRVFIHGDPTRGQKRCLALDSASTKVLNSYFLDCKHFAFDSQAIAGFNGPGPILIENNYIEGATENIMFGGSDPKTPYLVPSDIVIRRNLITKPLAWRNPILQRPASPRAAASSAKGVLGARTHYFKVAALLDAGGSVAHSSVSSEVSVTLASGTTSALISWSAVAGATRYRIYRGTGAGGESVYLNTSSATTSFVYTGSNEHAGKPPASGTRWNVKNLIELKNAQRVTIEGNIIQYVWKAGQNGYALAFSPRNSNNTAPWTVVQDVTVRYNIIRHANLGVNILGYDYSHSTGSQRTKRIKFLHNVWDDIGAAAWGGDGTGVVIVRGPADVTIDHNTMLQDGTIVVIDDGTSSGFVFRNNITLHHKYGIVGSGTGVGLPTLKTYFPGYIFERNVLAGGSSSLYPSRNYFPSVETFYKQFVNYTAGDYRLVSGSPYVGLGTDGLNLGADIGAVATATMGALGPSTTSGNVAPTAEANGPYTGTAGAAIGVSAAGSRDSDGTIASYRWNWGDGSADTSGAAATHVYKAAGTYTITLTVTDNSGAVDKDTAAATVRSSTSSAAAGDIVLTAADVKRIRGNWAIVSSSGSPGGKAIQSLDKGLWNTAAPLAQPAHYVDIPFQPAAKTSYRVWLRMKAPSKGDDSVWIQVTGGVNGAGTPLWRVGTAAAWPVTAEPCKGCQISGWGWHDKAWWLGTPPLVRFESAGPQTLRIQMREDGVMIDEIVLSPSTYLTDAPGAPSNDGTLLSRTAVPLARKDIVLRTEDAVRRAGNWYVRSGTIAADGQLHESADRSWSSTSAPLASPKDYVDITFTAIGGIPYRTWLRMSATDNVKWNDSVWLQYSGSLTTAGTATARIGTVSGILVDRQPCSGCAMWGWSWQNSAYWLPPRTIMFKETGIQRIRIQIRQDGVRFDQVVISPERYLSSAPGASNGDRTIVPR